MLKITRKILKNIGFTPFFWANKLVIDKNSVLPILLEALQTHTMPSNTSDKAAAASGKAAKAFTKRDKKKREGKRKESSAIYIYKVL